MLYWQIVEQLRAKVERADKHIRDLQEAWATFEAEEYVVKIKDDRRTGKRTYHLVHAPDIPDAILCIAGDAVHNLRCALDHVAYQLASVYTTEVGWEERVYFPVGKDIAEFGKELSKASKFKTKTTPKTTVTIFHPDAIRNIKALEPYKGGRGEHFWHLHHLDIIDKHRLLLAAGAYSPNHGMPLENIRGYQVDFLGMEGTESFKPGDFLQGNNSAPFPLKCGDKLHTMSLSEVGENMPFKFEAAFRGPPFIERKPIIETLQNMSRAVRSMIREFDDAGLLS